MIKAEVIFDGECIVVNGKRFTVAAEYSYDTIMLGLGDNNEYMTIEEAVKYCLENNE